MQKGEGNGIDKFDERDRQSVLDDPNSTIVEIPKSLECRMIVYMFNNSQFEYGMNGLQGFNYLSLKDTIKWNNLHPKDYVPILQRCMNNYLNGIRRS